MNNHNPAAENSCFRKRSYYTETYARKIAAFWNAENPPEGGQLFHAYLCPLCSQYHVGRTNPTYPPSRKRLQDERIN